MDLIKKIFYTAFVIVVAIILIKVAPIYYRGLSLKSICKENADIFHRYSAKYVRMSINERLDKLGIPKNQREIALTKTLENIVVEIYYEDEANFFDYYKKDFYFIEECEGVLDSVLAP